MTPLALDVAHLFAGGLVLVSVMLLYQDRMTGLINTFALHALVVSLSVAWQAYIQQAPHLYITAGIALVIAALCADGRTVIRSVEQIDRGYEDLDDKLRALGARVKRVAG